MTTTETRVWDKLAALVNEDGTPKFPTFRVECEAMFECSCKCNDLGWITNPRLLHDTDHVGLVIAAAEEVGWRVYIESWGRAGRTTAEFTVITEFSILPQTDVLIVHAGTIVTRHKDIRHALFLAVKAEAHDGN